MSLWSRLEKRLGDLASDLLADDARSEFEAAKELARTDPNAALDALSALRERYPDHPLTAMLSGAARLELGETETALGHFARALELDPELAEAWLGQGRALLLDGQLEDAVSSYRAAVKKARGDQDLLAEAYLGKGVAFRRLGELDKATRELRKAAAESPDSPEARALLGQTLFEDPGHPNEDARRHLRRALDSDPVPAVALLGLGELSLSDGDPAGARDYFRAAKDAPTPEPHLRDERDALRILMGLGRSSFELGQLDEASAHFVSALAADPGHAPARACLGDIAHSEGHPEDALVHYQQALAERDEPEILDKALRVAIAMNDTASGTALADRALSLDTDCALAHVAKGKAFEEGGKNAAALATYNGVIARLGHPEALFAKAQLLVESDPDEAMRALWAALRQRPDDPRGRQLIAQIRAVASDWQGPSHLDSALYALASATARLFRNRPELAGLVRDSASIAADFDRPLLVTVMGEFSSGKSSFVNAFIGHSIAPTGITPTTATINMVKYGRERRGRILFLDGSVEELAWSDLETSLRALDKRARTIEQVEILMPLEILERVNIVDTPGLNSILPEHEECARTFIARADAVVWLFSATQAGKKSERAALESIKAQGKKVLGVLNKADLLSESELSELQGHLKDELGDLLEDVVAISAETARQEPDDPSWKTLLGVLDERFFDHARELKRDAFRRRLGDLLDRGAESASDSLERHTRGERIFAEAAEAAHACQIRILDDMVPRVRADIGAEISLLYRQATREVLELVKPRSLPFGSHSATTADRDYLVSLLESGYESTLAKAHNTVRKQIRGHARELLGEGSGELAEEIMRAVEGSLQFLEAHVFARARAYVAGFLRGGFVDDFFSRRLSKIDLSEEAVYMALLRGCPDVDGVLAVPLAQAATATFDEVSELLLKRSQLAALHVYEIEVGMAKPIAELRRILLENDN